MAEFPALPLWTDAYLGDTTHLTTLEHGAYLLLLITAWRSRNNRLPDSDKLLARYAKLTPGQWTRIKPIIAQFFTIEDGFWTQGRLTDEANAVRQYRERQSAAGKASALKRKGRHSTTVELGCNQTPTPYSYSISNNIEPKGSCASRDAPAFTVQDFVESWNEAAEVCGLSKIRKLTDARRRAFNVRLREYPDLADWQSAFRCLMANKWMHGDNKTGWRADPDFFLQAKSFTKLVENQYGQADRP